MAECCSSKLLQTGRSTKLHVLCRYIAFRVNLNICILLRTVTTSSLSYSFSFLISHNTISSGIQTFEHTYITHVLLPVSRILETSGGKQGSKHKYECHFQLYEIITNKHIIQFISLKSGQTNICR